MNFSKLDFVYYGIIIFLSIVTVFDLFMQAGRPATMDGLVHVTTVEMFYQALKMGNFPVEWLGNFANYGMPMGIYVHQLTSYLGAFLIFIVHNPVTAVNIITFIGVLLSNIFFYIFLRLYFIETHAFLGTFLFNFASYRILNIYIRGAIPEFFGGVFLPLILLSLYFFVRRRSAKALLLFILFTALLVLTHPFNFVIYSFIFIPYFLFLIVNEFDSFQWRNFIKKEYVRIYLLFVGAVILGLGLTSYFIIPLSLEIKYFYYGLARNHLTPGQYLDFYSYTNPNWYYFTSREILTRGHVVEGGLVETTGVLLGTLYLIVKRPKFFSENSIIYFSVVVSFIILFFTLKYSGYFYRHINILSNIQLPWRMLSAYIFLPPIIFAFIFSRLRSNILVLLFILLICIIRFPQLYGKNYMDYAGSNYEFTPYNLHAVVMNTIWTGKTEDYPVERNKIGIIDGTGKILNEKINNDYREYNIEAKTNMHLVDYTFYFPGWNVYVDGVKTNIEYQNPAYRGVITYEVAAGKHNVILHFEDTTLRRMAKILTVIFVLIYLGLCIKSSYLRMILSY